MKFSKLKKFRWIEELLPGGAVHRNMSGGVGYYLDDKLSLILFERGGGEVFGGIRYPFDIWDGVAFAVEQVKQGPVFIQFPFLENHPASRHWLFVPAEAEDFEERVLLVLREVFKLNPLFGVPVKTTVRKRGAVAENQSGMSRPQSFSEPLPKKKTGEVPVEKTKRASYKIKSNKKPGNEFMMSVMKRRSKD